MSKLILCILNEFAVSCLLCGISRRWIDVCFQPGYNPLTRLKAQTLFLSFSVCMCLCVCVREIERGERESLCQFISVFVCVRLKFVLEKPERSQCVGNLQAKIGGRFAPLTIMNKEDKTWIQ